MPSDQNIAVVVGGDTSPLRRELASAQTALDNFAGKAKSAAAGVLGFGAAAAGAAAGGLAVIYARQSQIIDNMARTSDALGINIKDFQALNYVAEQNGVSQEGLSKALKKMEVSLGNASLKGGATADTLSAIGLSADQLVSMSPAQQLEALAFAVGKVDNQANRAAIATQLFGREGTNMVKVLDELKTNGLQPTVAELDALGISIDRVDAAKVEAANDAIDRAKSAINGAGNAIAVEMAPIIEVAVNKFLEMGKEAGGFGNIAKNAFSKAVSAAGFFGDMIQGLNVVWGGIKLVVAGFGATVVSVFEAAGWAITKFIDSGIANVNLLIKALNKLPEVDIDLIDTVSDSAFMTGLHEAGESARNKVAELRAELHDTAMQELPSDKAKKFMAEVEEAARKAGEKVANVVAQDQKTNTVTTLTNTQNKAKEAADKAAAEAEAARIEAAQKAAEQAASDLERIKSQYITEEELNRQHKENMKIIGDEYDAKKFESESQWLSIREQAIKEHHDRVAALEQQAKQSQMQMTVGAGVEALQYASVFNKKAFEIYKKFRIGEAAIAGVGSAIKAWEAGMSTGGPWAPFVAAAYTAASLAKTGAMISQMNSQSYGGGKGANQPAAGGSGIPQAPSGIGGGIYGGQSKGSGQTLTVAPIDPNAIFSGASMQQFGQRIFDYSKDGGKVIFQT